jgi:hypothetical protein
MDLMYLSPRQPLGSYRSLLVHEFQHLISFNQHVLIRGGQAEASWLNEGLSHLAEDQVASFSVSGQSEIIAAFLKDPGAVGLAGDALLDVGKRGAAYLFVRSLVDRFGDAVIVRLMTSGLIDHDNIEAATGESFGQLLAFWGGQLYLSGLGVVSHQRLNYSSALLRAGDDRGFALPTAQTYRVGGVEIEASIRPHGVQFIHLQGRSPARLTVAGEPDAGLSSVVIPLASGFAPTVWVPADYIAGLRFTE